MILAQYDSCKDSTFNPNEIENKIPNFPKIGVTCFSRKLINKIIKEYNPEQIAVISNANEKVPVYKLNYKGLDIAFFMSRVGASACTVSYEEILAMGLEKLIMFGTCGVLDKDIEDLSIIVPTHAIRDEGTSYHYLEASDEIEVNKKYKIEFIELLKKHKYPYIEGKTWTTDAPYRETKDKVIKRKKAGCVCVEMECSAMNAVAEFRNKDLFTFFYAADNLDSQKWEPRSLGCNSNLNEKEKIVFLAFELALKIGSKENQMQEHRHAILIIQNNKNEYLQYYDDRWNSYLFLNCKLQKDFTTKDILNQLTEQLNINVDKIECIYITDKIHTKHSESANIDKEYHHYFFKIIINSLPNEFKNKKLKYNGIDFQWFSMQELEEDKRIQEVNSDIVGYVKEMEGK